MKKDIYIWELSTNSLLRILENSEEPAIIEWHPSRPLIATTGIETGGIQFWGIEPQQKWSALAPDFAEVDENVEYVEREDEFDEYPEEERTKRRLDREDEEVDIFTIEPTKADEEEAFVLPVIIGVDQDTDDDDELVPTGVGTMRKKEANEGREWEESAEPVVVARRRARRSAAKVSLRTLAIGGWFRSASGDSHMGAEGSCATRSVAHHFGTGLEPQHFEFHPSLSKQSSLHNQTSGRALSWFFIINRRN